jgi:hypothetical protein
MDPKQLREIVQRVINKEKWWDTLSRFIDVLHINIFIVDTEGRVILPPEEGKYGGGFLTKPSLGFDFLNNTSNLIQKFRQNGIYLEYTSPLGLYMFAIPVMVEQNKTIAYMIVGPVILNRKLDQNQYTELTQKSGIDLNEFLNELSGIRVVSNIMLNSILDLLSEIIKDNIELSLKDKFIKNLDKKYSLPNELNKVAQEIYSTVRLDELLVTLLDVALKMTETESGSIMVIDEKNKNLTIKVSRGISEAKVNDAKIKLGEGIAGIAAKENESFLIEGQKGDNRIKHLLKRPEIKHALVMPLIAKDHVIGVLNLSTSKEESKIEDNFDNLQYLAKLLSSVF